MLTSRTTRRGGDSNPRRRDYRRNGFRDRRIQPLCHLSVAECIHLVPPLQPQPPSKIMPHNPVSRSPVCSNSPIISFPANEARPASSASRGKSPANTCILCDEIGSDEYAGRSHNINHAPQENSVRSPLRASEVTLVREADPATISAVHRGIGQADVSTQGSLRFCRKGFQMILLVTLVVTLGRRSSCRLGVW
jgi:hypothetical protein